MSLRAISNSMQQFIPANPFSGKYSLNLPRIASNLSKVAVPAIAIIALSNISGAEALPPCYIACVALCTGGGTAIVFPPAVLTCLSGCIPLMFLPVC